jgi:hypothetical protein
VGCHEKDQRDEEGRDLATFLRATGADPDQVIPGENPPDFYLILGGRRIGVEHTNFHRPDEEQARLAAWRRLQGLIEERRRTVEALKSVAAVVSFQGDRIPPRNVRQAFAAELLVFVTERLPLTTDLQFFEFPDCFPILREHLKLLDLQSSGQAINLRWLWDRELTSFLGGDPEEIGETIWRKTLTSRPAGVEEFWLLVAISGVSFGQMAPELDAKELAAQEDLETTLRASSFDRVFLNEAMFHRLLVWSRPEGWTEQIVRQGAGSEK